MYLESPLASLSAPDVMYPYYISTWFLLMKLRCLKIDRHRGKARKRDIEEKARSSRLAPKYIFGQSPNFYKTKLPISGNKTIGIGRIALVMAVFSND